MLTHPPAPSAFAFVPFVSVKNMMALVNATGIETVLRELAAYIEDDFKRWPDFETERRVASHSIDGVIEFMPTADADNYTFKYVNGHPKNVRDGYQTVTAFGVLSSVANGYPILLTEMTLLTAMRTAAMSALSARYLAPQGARTMAVIGNGAQCEFQAIAFRAICEGIDTVHLYDIDPKATEKAMPEPCGARPDERALLLERRGGGGCRHHHHLHGGQAVFHHSHGQHGGSGRPHKRDRWRLSGQDRNYTGISLPAPSIFVEFAPETRIEGEIQQPARRTTPQPSCGG